MIREMINPSLINDICRISREGICLLDMKQVQEKAEQLGLIRLAELVAGDLKDNRILNGQYYPIVSNLYGVAS